MAQVLKYGDLLAKEETNLATRSAIIFVYFQEVSHLDGSGTSPFNFSRSIAAALSFQRTATYGIC
jgi:hypothetical protein